MSDSLDTQKLILQVFGVVVGGGLLQLIIFLLKRRSTLRALDTSSDATQLTSANEFIAILQAEMKILRAEITQLKSEIDSLKRQLSIAHDDAARDVTRAEDTVNRLTLDLARSRSDIAVLRAEVGEIAVPPPQKSRHSRGDDS